MVYMYIYFVLLSTAPSKLLVAQMDVVKANTMKHKPTKTHMHS